MEYLSQQKLKFSSTNRKTWIRPGLDWCGSRQGQVAGSCEYGNELPSPIKCGNFLTIWGTVSFLALCSQSVFSQSVSHWRYNWHVLFPYYEDSLWILVQMFLLTQWYTVKGIPPTWYCFTN